MVGFQKMKPKDLIGVIYPIRPKQLERIFDGKDIFCKYHGRGRYRLGRGNYVMFYASGIGEIRGQARITDIEFLKPAELVNRYGTRLFITEQELEDYRGTRSIDKELMVLTLSKVQRFDTPLKPLKPITMSGWTLSKSEYEAQLDSRLMSITGS